MTQLRALEAFVRPIPQLRPQCELCGGHIESEHAHVVDLADRALRCACRGCAILFSQGTSGGSKYRTAPDRWLHDPSFRVSEAQWNSLQIPVRVAFFFRNSELGRWVAFYPGAAGAAESLLGMDTWEELVRGTAISRVIEPDTEAIIVSGERGADYKAFLVPIQSCYELVGLVKLHWRGFDGGDEAWRRIEGFFIRIQARSSPIGDGLV
jgi:hypothetical protein